MPNNEAANAQFVSIAARLINADMTQADYDSLRDVAEILNPNLRGYVKTLNDDVSKIAPSIKIR